MRARAATVKPSGALSWLEGASEHDSPHSGFGLVARMFGLGARLPQSTGQSCSAFCRTLPSMSGPKDEAMNPACVMLPRRLHSYVQAIPIMAIYPGRISAMRAENSGPGDWPHGWQYHASRTRKQRYRNRLSWLWALSQFQGARAFSATSARHTLAEALGRLSDGMSLVLICLNGHWKKLLPLNTCPARRTVTAARLSCRGLWWAAVIQPQRCVCLDWRPASAPR